MEPKEGCEAITSEYICRDAMVRFPGMKCNYWDGWACIEDPFPKPALPSAANASKS